MLSKWPIRVKLLLGLGLLVLVVGILSRSGLYTMYAYRGLVKSLSWRVVELPVAARLSRQVGELQITLSRLYGLRANTLADAKGNEVPARVRMLRVDFQSKLDQVESTLAEYQGQLEEHQFEAGSQMGDNRREWATVAKIQESLARIHQDNAEEDWMLDRVKVDRLEPELKKLQALAAKLPSHLHARMAGFADAERSRYRTLIVGAWITSGLAVLLLALFVRLGWQWVFQPLRMLIYGSRRVAAGQFNYRIHLDSRDEMSELAEALNDMTARFQDIRDDLDRQVRQRTKQVVRNEQLASVGFLAAGVAHEINNPLASIAMCAESLEGRIREILEGRAGERQHGEQDPGEGETVEGETVEGEAAEQQAAEGDTVEADRQQREVIQDYLQVIQKEAFRCKEITEKLLDFSRIGQTTRHSANLAELVQDVIEMVGHLGKYQRKQVEFARRQAVVAEVNAQEIKQVVLNLLTNALDSLEDEGTVWIELRGREGFAELTFADNGCGMEPAVLEHVFEPFFTRRRGGQGTGLGLSITYRIVADHGGTIEALSPGPGQGATFRVRLPLADTHKEAENRYQAA